MSDFRFADPLAFVFLLVPLAYYLLRRRSMTGLVYSDTRLFSHLPISLRMRVVWLPDFLRWLAWLALVIALARPQSGNAVEVIRGQGVDIVLALDISTSMAALDFEPLNRLETAKMVIAEFIENRDFDQIGLVVFARNAYHQAPSTLDYPVLLQLLDQVQLVSELRFFEERRLNGTAIGLGLAASANMLRDSDTASKVIILLTDGDNNAGIDPTQAAQAVTALGIRIYTIGMGRPGVVQVPGEDGETTLVESDLNEDALREIAAVGGGLYFRAEDAQGLQQIYNRIDLLERSDAERLVFVRWQDRASLVLVVALISLIGERVLRRTLFEGAA
jgi:Ca-activated chloride channel homolog